MLLAILLPIMMMAGPFLMLLGGMSFGDTDLLPALCATDHILPKLIHVKLIRTHTCATGSESRDYWYVGDESAAARAYANTEMK